ncbi:MAG TPA: hypothetical protein VIN40_01310 [Candidatus Tyrphobacter sp.]
MMKPDDEIAFLRARDDSRVEYRQIENLRALRAGLCGDQPRHPILAANVKALPGIIHLFQSHGQTLRRLQERYPEEERVGQAISLWEDAYRTIESVL